MKNKDISLTPTKCPVNCLLLLHLSLTPFSVSLHFSLSLAHIIQKFIKMPPADMTRSMLRGFTCLSAEMQMRSIICHKLHSGNNRLLHHVISSSQHPPTEVAALLIVHLSTPALLFLIAPKSNWGCDIAFVATGWIKTKVQVTI